MMQQYVYINYINGVKLPEIGKAKFILDNLEEAEPIPEPVSWEEDIVCVVENLEFDAARYIDNEYFLEVARRNDGRDKTWLRVPGAKQLCSAYDRQAP